MMSEAEMLLVDSALHTSRGTEMAATGDGPFLGLTCVGLHSFLQERRGGPIPQGEASRPREPKRYWSAHSVRPRPIALRSEVFRAGAAPSSGLRQTQEADRG